LTSCDIQFGVGQRWLFGGVTQLDPSVMLGRADESSAAALGRLHRKDDARSSFPAEWQLCAEAAQCVMLPYGCSKTSVVLEHEPAARRQAWRIGGDPSLRECAGPPANTQDFHPPLCVAGRCGAWFFDFR
jgi:hypothetical protein